MKFSTVLFASSVAAFNATETAEVTVIETITSCSEAGPCVTSTVTSTSTYCPETNATSSVAPFEGAAAAGHANIYAAGAAALAAGAMLL
ncbi:DEKNAAC105356 [Brettanomyces naardenensis]|uniref:DEKNAAC105356 n=1 Tax=Brettanomyces naardenensis TaxID=13370 RepID=A0A448YTF3_BRENA|nr:DEKNAAC105356 [Brettanomyces naardenensis]